MTDPPDGTNGVLVDDLRDATLFSRDCGREAVAELRSVTERHPARIAGVGGREVAPVRSRRHAVEVIERLRQTQGEARPLQEGAVCTERVRRRVQADVAGAHTNGDIAADRAVFRLVAGISRDVATRTERAVARGTVTVVAVERTPGHVAVIAIGGFGADPAAHLQAHIGAGDVIEPDAIQATNLHVLDRFGLNGKIGRLRPSYSNESRRRTKEKTFHHLHLEPPKHCFLRGFGIRPVRQHPLELPLAPRWPETLAHHVVRSLLEQRNRGMPPSVAGVTLAEGPL